MKSPDERMSSVVSDWTDHVSANARRMGIPKSRVRDIAAILKERLTRLYRVEGSWELSRTWDQARAGERAYVAIPPDGWKSIRAACAEFAALDPLVKYAIGPIPMPQISVAHTRQWKRWRRFLKRHRTK